MQILAELHKGNFFNHCPNLKDFLASFYMLHHPQSESTHAILHLSLQITARKADRNGFVRR